MLRGAFHLLRPKRSYEPLEIGGRRIAGKRDAEARWEAVASTLRRYEAQNILDIGCAEAWFLRRAAREFGTFGIGVEAAERRVLVGEIARLHDGAERVAVMQARLAPEDILRLPVCDVVICLSVVHHIMREGGLDAARKFVAALVTRAKKVVLFEIGTSDEVSLKWTEALPDMPAGQEAFVRELLLSAGLQNIRVVATTPGLRGDVPRLLFAAEPA